LAQAFGATRWLWNKFLEQINSTYKETGKGLSRYDLQKQLPELKKEYKWLKQPYSQCLQVVCLNLSRAFINFFERRASYPRFKSKHKKQSLTYPQNVKILDSDYLSFPKLGNIQAKIHRQIESNIKTVTITKNRCNQYFASILFEDGKELPTPSSQGKAIGIDVGLTHFAITSDGSKYDNPRWLNKHEKNLKRKQQDLARKKGTSNKEKARKLVAKVHLKITRCREDFLHKLSRKLVDDNQVLVLENLNIKGMVKNHCLAKSISQVGWGQFATMLKYKVEKEGKIYLEIDRFFPSSKTCNHCLNVVGSLPLDVREWTCSSCNTSHDRDINAAKNLRDEGLRIIQASGTGVIAASCPDVRRNRGGRKKSTVTQSVGEEAPDSALGGQE